MPLTRGELTGFLEREKKRPWLVLTSALACLPDGQSFIEWLLADSPLAGGAGPAVAAWLSPEHGLFGSEEDQKGEDRKFGPDGRAPVISLYPLEEARASAGEEYFKPDIYRGIFLKPFWDWCPPSLPDTAGVLVCLPHLPYRFYTYAKTTLIFLEALAREDFPGPVVVFDAPVWLPPGRVHGVEYFPRVFSDYFLNLDFLEFRHGRPLSEILAGQATLKELNLFLPPKDPRGEQPRFFTPPSPNLPGPLPLHYYDGLVLLEGTNLAMGRGTSRAFQIFGHPALEPYRLIGYWRKFLTKLEAFRPKLPDFYQAVWKAADLFPVYWRAGAERYHDRGTSLGGFQIIWRGGPLRDYHRERGFLAEAIFLLFFLAAFFPEFEIPEDPYEAGHPGGAMEQLTGSPRLGEELTKLIKQARAGQTGNAVAGPVSGSARGATADPHREKMLNLVLEKSNAVLADLRG